jgi:cytidylate kinase
MFRVITVAREYGSGGHTIAQKIAERLRWRLLDKELIAAAARTAQVDLESAREYDESVDPWWHRIARDGLWSASIFAGANPGDAQFFDAEAMAILEHELIAATARKGDCVIVGRGAQCVLQDCSEAFHVFIYAPWEQRVARTAKRVTAACNVGDLLRSSDRMRATYIRRYFGRDWKDPDLYHMMLSSELGDDEVADLIIDGAGCRETVGTSRSGLARGSGDPGSAPGRTVISQWTEPGNRQQAGWRN